MWSCRSSFACLVWIVNIISITLGNPGTFFYRLQSYSYRSIGSVGKYQFHYEKDSERYMNFLITYGTLITTPFPEFVEVTAGTRVELVCEAIGHPSPHIFWIYGKNRTKENDEVLKSLWDLKYGRKKYEDNFGIVSSKLVIDSVTSEHEGPVKCISVTRDKMDASETKLRVDSSETTNCNKIKSERKLAITFRSLLVFAYVNRTVTLPCRFISEPTFYFYWYDDQGRYIDTSTQGRITALSNGDLQIKNLQSSDMHTYTCVVNSGYTERTASTFLYPLLEIQHNQTSKTVTVKVGESADHVRRSLEAFASPFVYSYEQFRLINLTFY